MPLASGVPQEAIGDAEPLGFAFDGEPDESARPQFTSETRPSMAQAINEAVEQAFGEIPPEQRQAECDVYASTATLLSVLCVRNVPGRAFALNFDLSGSKPVRLRAARAFSLQPAGLARLASKCLGDLLLEHGGMPPVLKALPSLATSDLDAFGVLDGGKVEVHVPYSRGGDPFTSLCALTLGELGATPDAKAILQVSP
jgi:hypothetical protein